MITCVKASSSPSTLMMHGSVGLLTNKTTCGASSILSMSIKKRARVRMQPVQVQRQLIQAQDQEKVQWTQMWQTLSVRQSMR